MVIKLIVISGGRNILFRVYESKYVKKKNYIYDEIWYFFKNFVFYFDLFNLLYEGGFCVRKVVMYKGDSR